MRRPQGSGEPVLYLDYDGVLHHEEVWWHYRRGAYVRPTGFTLFEHAPLLADLLRPYPSVRIVLSTSWVRVRRFSRAKKRLPQELRERVIGSTFHTAMNQARFETLSRGMQVWEDVQRRQPSDWFALDDNTDWPECCRDNLVLTDPVRGISAPGMEALVRAHIERICLGRTA